MQNERHKTRTKQKAYLDYSIPCRSGKHEEGLLSAKSNLEQVWIWVW